MKFNYQARTKEGEIHAGQVDASSRETAATLLQKQGFYVTFLQEDISPIYAKKIRIFEGISRKDIVLFSRLLAIMFVSKVPMIESLKVLASQTKNIDLKEKILELSEEVEGGTPLSKALSMHPKIFSPFYIAMVKSGEISGKLSEVLNYLATHLEKEYALAAKTKGALIYPILILVVIFAVLGIMAFFVIPQLALVLEGGGTELPLITKVVIAGSDFLRNWWWVMAIVTFFTVLGGTRYYFTANGRRFFDRATLGLPIFGPFLKMLYIARFAENLSTLISGGLPIAQALETTGDIIGNLSYKKIVFEARDEVRKGEPISSVLSKHQDLFSPVFVQMVLVGEKTGTMDTTLTSIVKFYQDEMDRSIDGILDILEPALIVFLGVIVGGIMLSVLLPLYKMISV